MTDFQGHINNDDHRTKGVRAYCLLCGENCSPTIPCLCCAEPMLVWRVAELEAELEETQRRLDLYENPPHGL